MGLVPPEGFEPSTYGLAYPLQLSLPAYITTKKTLSRSAEPSRDHLCILRYGAEFFWTNIITAVCGLDHIFAISGGMRMASTEPCNNQMPNEYLLTDYSSVCLPSTRLND